MATLDVPSPPHPLMHTTPCSTCTPPPPPPLQWAMYRRELMLNLHRWAVDEYLEVAPGVQAAELQAFYKRLMSR